MRIAQLCHLLKAARTRTLDLGQKFASTKGFAPCLLKPGGSQIHPHVAASRSRYELKLFSMYACNSEIIIFHNKFLCFSCLEVSEQTSEAFEGVLHPHVQRFKGTRRSNGVERVICNPVANLWDHVWERKKKRKFQINSA